MMIITGSDMVKLSNGSIPVVRADIELIKDSANFFANGSNWQGILGLAYRAIAIPTVSKQRPTPFFDSLVVAGKHCY